MEHTSVEVLLLWVALGANLWAAKECFLRMGGVVGAAIAGMSVGAAFGLAVDLFMIFFSLA